MHTYIYDSIGLSGLNFFPHVCGKSIPESCLWLWSCLQQSVYFFASLVHYLSEVCYCAHMCTMKIQTEVQKHVFLFSAGAYRDAHIHITHVCYAYTTTYSSF